MTLLFEKIAIGGLLLWYVCTPTPPRLLKKKKTEKLVFPFSQQAVVSVINFPIIHFLMISFVSYIFTNLENETFHEGFIYKNRLFYLFFFFWANFCRFDQNFCKFAFFSMQNINRVSCFYKNKAFLFSTLALQNGVSCF